jgi:hypothetical protein
MNKSHGILLVLLSIHTISFCFAKTPMDFQQRYREQLNVKGPVKIIYEENADIVNGIEKPRKHISDLIFNRFGDLKESNDYTSNEKNEIIENTKLLWSYNEQNLPLELKSKFKSNYKNQFNTSEYILKRDKKGHIIEVTLVISEASSNIFDNNYFKTSYKYDSKDRVTEKKEWIEKKDLINKKKTYESKSLKKYTYQQDIIIIDIIGQSDNWKGKIVNRIWLDKYKHLIKEYQYDDTSKISGKIFYTYNKQGYLILEKRGAEIHSTEIISEYENYDSYGNWTKKITSWKQENVDNYKKRPSWVTYRKYTYFKELKYSKLKQKTVNICVDPFSPENGTEPIEKMIEAIEKNEKSNTFYVNWNGSGCYSGNGGALYNRSQQTLKYWFDIGTTESNTREYCMMLDVDVNLLKKIAEKNKNKCSTTGAALFDYLEDEGCDRKGFNCIYESR